MAYVGDIYYSKVMSYSVKAHSKPLFLFQYRFLFLFLFFLVALATFILKYLPLEDTTKVYKFVYL
jgi:hypothetical protein